MSHLKPYSKPKWCERLKIAFHYLLPQMAITRAASWFAQKKWGGITHFVISQFARVYQINWNEAKKNRPQDFATFNEFFTRELIDGARPIISGSNTLALPADGRVSESGFIHDNHLLQAKGHSFTLEDLLAGDIQLAMQFKNGSFLTTYLSPRDYHRVHMPCDGVLRKMIYVSGELFSVNPFSAQHIPNLFARNERVICVFDTEFGPMAQILVGATVTASIQTVWHGVVNPHHENGVHVWDYPAEGDNVVKLAKGEQMGAFLLGSTVINLFPQGAVKLDGRLTPNAMTRMGDLLGTLGE